MIRSSLLVFRFERGQILGFGTGRRRRDGDSKKSQFSVESRKVVRFFSCTLFSINQSTVIVKLCLSCQCVALNFIYFQPFFILFRGN